MKKEFYIDESKIKTIQSISESPRVICIFNRYANKLTIEGDNAEVETLIDKIRKNNIHLE